MAFNLPSCFAAAMRPSIPPKSSAEVAVEDLPVSRSVFVLVSPQPASVDRAIASEQARLAWRRWCIRIVSPDQCWLYNFAIIPPERRCHEVNDSESSRED